MRAFIVFTCCMGIFHPAFGVEHQCFPEVMTPTDYLNCLEAANGKAEKELKSVFGKALVAISGPSVAQAEKHKRKLAAEKAHAKWHEYRDAECFLAEEVFGNGGVTLECRFGLTNARIKYLHENYNIK